jgi:hypothetical protein
MQLPPNPIPTLEILENGDLWWKFALDYSKKDNPSEDKIVTIRLTAKLMEWKDEILKKFYQKLPNITPIFRIKFDNIKDIIHDQENQAVINCKERRKRALSTDGYKTKVFEKFVDQMVIEHYQKTSKEVIFTQSLIDDCVNITQLLECFHEWMKVLMYEIFCSDKDLMSAYKLKWSTSDIRPFKDFLERREFCLFQKGKISNRCKIIGVKLRNVKDVLKPIAEEGKAKRLQLCWERFCEGKIYNCESCEKSFSKESALKTHNKSQHTKCDSCGLEGTSPTFGYKYCYPCGCHKYGRTPIEKRQDQVFNFLLKELSDVEGIEELLFDKKDPSPDNCGVRARADVRIITIHRTIIIEVDENQHNSENYACLKSRISDTVSDFIINDRRKRIKIREDDRMRDITWSGEVKPIIFIRFNPDSWKDENGIVHPKEKTVPEGRLDTLLLEILYWLDVENPQEHFSEVVYLYYNGEFRQTDFILMVPDEIKSPKKGKISV